MYIEYRQKFPKRNGYEAIIRAGDELHGGRELARGTGRTQSLALGAAHKTLEWVVLARDYRCLLFDDQGAVWWVDALGYQRQGTETFARYPMLCMSGGVRYGDQDQDPLDSFYTVLEHALKFMRDPRVGCGHKLVRWVFPYMQIGPKIEALLVDRPYDEYMAEKNGRAASCV